MSFEEVFPIVIPMVFTQLFVQVYFIKHCWESERLAKKQKVWLTVLIAAFQVPGAAIYMFFWGRTKPEFASRSLDAPIDDGIQKGIFILLVIAYEALTVLTLINGARAENRVLILATTGAVFVIAIVYNLLVKPKHALLYFTLPALMILLALFENYLDFTMYSHFIVFTVVISIINGMYLKYARIYSFCALCLYVGSEIVKVLNSGVTDTNNLIGTIYFDTVLFILLFAAFYAVKKQLILNGMLQKAFADLKEKSEMLEEMGAITERNRIAGEIHDTVGHKLTAAIVSIEAGEKMLDSDRGEAQNKLRLARDQVMSGLQSIRMSVKAIKQGEAETDFIAKVKGLVQQIGKDTGLKITDIIELKSNLLPIQQSVLLQAIVECATNCIKHGKSTQADLLIQEHKGTVRMTFSDNGQGSEAPAAGFGLNNMRERVESLGGTLQTESAIGEGFAVSVCIPAGRIGDGEA